MSSCHSSPCSARSSRPDGWPSTAPEDVAMVSMTRSRWALDAQVERFRGSPLGDLAYPYLWLDATFFKVREAGRIVSVAAPVAVGVTTSGGAPGAGARARDRQRRGHGLAGLHQLLVERACTACSSS
jgi:hypothetical protein